ncbi:unnamed protein product [Musa banksii]
MGTGCKSALHHLHRDKARNRVDDLQSAIKDCRAADVAVLEEQVHQRLRECWAELNQPSPATSLQVIESEADLSFCLFTLRLLQLSEEEDDATSKLAELAFGNTPKPELVELQQADVGAAQGGRAANFQEVNTNLIFFSLCSNLQTGPDKVTCHEGNGRNVFPYMSDVLPAICPRPSAFLRPKCALWDCPRPAQGSEWCRDYCSSFHATLAINEDMPGMTLVLRPGGIDLKDGPLFAALSTKIQGKFVGIPVFEGAATARSPWNASGMELFDLCVLEDESLREWLFF